MNNKLILIILFVVFFLSIGFSKFTNNLSLDGINAYVRLERDVRVTSVALNGNLSSNDMFYSYLEYDVQGISSSYILPSKDSKIVFEVQVKNFGNTEVGILKLEGLDDSLEYELIDYKLIIILILYVIIIYNILKIFNTTPFHLLKLFSS